MNSKCGIRTWSNKSTWNATKHYLYVDKDYSLQSAQLVPDGYSTRRGISPWNPDFATAYFKRSWQYCRSGPLPPCKASSESLVRENHSDYQNQIPRVHHPAVLSVDLFNLAKHTLTSEAFFNRREERFGFLYHFSQVDNFYKVRLSGTVVLSPIKCHKSPYVSFFWNRRLFRFQIPTYLPISS